MEINAYNSQQVNSAYTKDLKVAKGEEALGMQDFLNLLVAQMTNQDALNPMDNTEFIAQMAQFSSLQAMTDLTKMTMQSQATSLIGKNVVVANYNNFGELIVQEGVVERVTIHSGQTKLYVNNQEFDYANVMEIKGAVATEQEDPVLKTLGDILNGIKELKEPEDDITEEVIE